MEFDTIDIPNKQTHFMLEEELKSDMILFDSTKAKQMVTQYSQFHLNFKNVNFFEEIRKERVKFADIYHQNYQKVNSRQSQSDSTGCWIKNYFFPLSTSRLFGKVEISSPLNPKSNILQEVELLKKEEVILESHQEIVKTFANVSTTDNTKDLSLGFNSLSNQENLGRESNPKRDSESSKIKSSTNMNFYRLHSSDLEEYPFTSSQVSENLCVLEERTESELDKSEIKSNSKWEIRFN